jgi:ComF family protein
LGGLLAESLPDTEKPDCLIPVPLHKTRYWQRGFNQSLEIARVVAKQRNIALRYDICQRHRATQQQTQLTAKQRRSNVKNAFALIRPVPFQHIVLIDDVMTTGSTVNELARLFKQAGVPRVDVWVCARA